jgi:hypothetical protein
MVFLAILFVLVCIMASAIIAVLLRDSFVIGKLNEYVTILEEHGDDSIDEHNFWTKHANSSLYEMLAAVRQTRNSAYTRGRKEQEAINMVLAAQRKGLEGVLTKVVKNKRSSRPGNGKNKK